MKLINTPENIFSDGKLYLNIYIAGFLFLFLYNVCTGIFNALGNSRTPLYFLIFSSVGNILLDLLFVAVFQWGVAGVAWATFIAQGVSCVLSFFTLLKRLKRIETNGTPKMFSKKMLIRVTRIAVPSILQQSFVSIGNMFIQTYVNGFGSAAIAGYSAAIKLNTFAITSFTTLANGLSSFAAQNIGARKMERVRKGLFSGLFLAFLVAVPFFVLYFFFSNTMMSLFLEEAEASSAVTVGIKFLKIASPFYFIGAIKLMCDGLLRGAGMMAGFMSSTFTDLLLRVLIAGFLSGNIIKMVNYGTTGIWMAWPVGWSISAVISVVFTCFVLKKKEGEDK
jgi:putative MATE family efflux protein